MNKNITHYEDEIDLIALFKTIWDGKIKILIITIISFLVGIGYSYLTPKNYLTSLTINETNGEEFTIYNNINKLLKSDIPNELLVKTTVRQFVDKLNDYEEFLFNIKKTKKFQENISKLKIEEQKIELFKYSKLLEIVEPTKNKKNYIINFKWHDPNEAKKILIDTLNLTHNNLKINIYDNFNRYLEFKKKLKLNLDTIRLTYLEEQSIIAKELDIVGNHIDNVNLNSSKVSLSINTSDSTYYYLRGFKAIDKEIEIIKNRDYQNFKFIKQLINDFKDTQIKLIDYNIYLIDVKLIKNPKLILISSILLGLIIGVLYVLISAVVNHKRSLKNK